MQELIKKDYNGFAIEFELIDGQLMANATAMCNAFGKRAQHWLELAQTQRYISALHAKPEIPALVEVRQGGSAGGTWINERLILKLAQWLDVDFEIWCDNQIAELLRVGRVELKRLTPAELILAQAQQLVDHERRVTDLEFTQDQHHKQLTVLGDRVEEVEAKQTTIESQFYTVSGYAKKFKQLLPTSAARQYGKMAAEISRQHGYKIGTVPDAKYGEVNTYHMEVLRSVFKAPPVVPPKRPARR